MSEKKTFKNPKLVTGWEDGKVAWHSVSEYPSPGKFLVDEWDMEVTFTKKVKPFQVNDQVILTGGGELAIIWHIIDDRAWVNVVASSGGSWRDSHHVVKLSELKHDS